MNGLLQDPRHAQRQSGKAPAFDAVARITLALGVGANRAGFSVINRVVPPYDKPGRLIEVHSLNWHNPEPHSCQPVI
jgi:hypothetical protein